MATATNNRKEGWAAWVAGGIKGAAGAVGSAASKVGTLVADGAKKAVEVVKNYAPSKETAALVVGAAVVAGAVAAAAPLGIPVAAAATVGGLAAATETGMHALTSKNGVNADTPLSVPQTEMHDIVIECNNGKTYQVNIPVPKNASQAQIQIIANALKETVFNQLSAYGLITIPGTEFTIIPLQDGGWSIDIVNKNKAEPKTFKQPQQVVIAAEHIKNMSLETRECFKELRKAVTELYPAAERTEALSNLKKILQENPSAQKYAPPGFVNGSSHQPGVRYTPEQGNNLCAFNATMQVHLRNPKTRAAMKRCNGTKLQWMVCQYEKQMRSGDTTPIDLTLVREEIAKGVPKFEYLADGNQHTYEECTEALFTFMESSNNYKPDERFVRKAENVPTKVDNRRGTYRVNLQKHELAELWEKAEHQYPAVRVSLPPPPEDAEEIEPLELGSLMAATLGGRDPERDQLETYDSRGGIQFEDAPEFLDVHIDRCTKDLKNKDQNTYVAKKIRTRVIVPPIVELPQQHLKTQKNQAVRYRLEGFVVHIGTVYGPGHLVAYPTSLDENGVIHYWKLDDANRWELSEEEFLAAAGMSDAHLHYVREDCTNPKPVKIEKERNKPADAQSTYQLAQFGAVNNPLSLLNPPSTKQVNPADASTPAKILWNSVRRTLAQARQGGAKTVAIQVPAPADIDPYNADWYLAIMLAAVQCFVEGESETFERVTVVLPAGDDPGAELIHQIRKDAEYAVQTATECPIEDNLSIDEEAAMRFEVLMDTLQCSGKLPSKQVYYMTEDA